MIANTYTLNDQKTPRIAALNNKFVIVWESENQDGSFYEIYGRIYNNSDVPINNNEFRINSYTTGMQKNPSIASLNNNRFAVVWSSYGQGGYYSGLYVQLYYDNGDKDGSEFFIGDSSYSLFSDIYGLSNSNFIVVWSSQDGYGTGVFGQIFYNNGTIYKNKFMVNTIIDGYQDVPVVRELSNNQIVIVWEEILFRDIYARLYITNGDVINDSEFRAAIPAEKLI